MDTINLLDAVKTERDEQKRRYMVTYMEALHLGDLTRADEQDELDRIEKEVRELTDRCRKRETELESLREQNHDEYVSQMVDLCDDEAKTFSKLMSELKALVREVGLRRASLSLSNIGRNRKT